MKNFTKLIALFLAIVMLLSTAVACNGDTPADTTGSATAPSDTRTPSDTTGTSVDTTTPDTTTEEETTAPPPTIDELFNTPETVTIIKKASRLNYTITRPMLAESNSAEMGMVQEISAFLSEKLGVAPQLDTDKQREEDPEKLEIIVGATDHPETAALLPELTYGNYIMRAVGNKLIVISFDEAGYTRAFSHIKRIFGKGYNSSTNEITIDTASFNKSEPTKKQLDAVPVYEGGKYLTTYDAARVTAAASCYEIIIRETNFREYDKYLEKLDGLGYTQYSTNAIGNNKFAIYTNDEYTLNLGYYDYEKSARLLVEPKGALPTLANDNNTEKVTDAQITMIAVGHGDTANGLSMLIRLEDGRFIVIDGAAGDNRDHLIETIKYQSLKYSKGKPVIAAWIITHGHGDHAGLLESGYDAIKNSGITVERIFVNEILDATAGTMAYGNGRLTAIIEKAAPTFGAELYKPHVGQTFYLSNCKIDVLYTHEALAPRAPGNDYNVTSVIMKMTFTDSETGKITTFLSTGDATGVAMDVARDIFGSYMKSDIITVNHHGYGSGSNGLLQEVYRVVAPALVLWPVGKKDINSVKNGASKVLLQTGTFKEVYFAGNRGAGGRDVVVPIPYTQGYVIGEAH